jgi:transcriptional regulator with GAF, ATPase, and Fis domain
MKRRSRTGGEPIKGRRRKTPGPKRRNAPKAAARSNSPPTGKAEEFAQLARELGEAIERQNATTEVLQVINSSCGDLQPVFQTMLAKAVQLCKATFGVLWLAEGDRFRSVALHNLPPAFAAARQREPVVYFGPKSGTGRLIEKKQIFQIEDLTKDPGYIERDPRIIPLVELGGARTALFAPLLQKSHVIGSLVLYRQEVFRFGDKQIALVENFAAQAVIAIENARLLNELRQRTTDLSEALEQQTATSEVLQVISGSPDDLEPVFASMLENAVRICNATFGNIYRWDGQALHLLAAHNTPPAFAEARKRSPRHPAPNTPQAAR